jgi:transferase CAF17, mitochondrial
VLFDAFIYTVDPSFLGSDSEFGKWDPIHIIEVDRSLLPNLKTHLNRYKLRSRFHIHDIPERRLQLYSVWPDLEWHQEVFSQAVTITDPRSVNLGTRVLTSQTPPIDPSKLQQLEVYHIRRTLHGVPEGPEEILEGQALPAESNLDVLSGIDYTKGCYVGQELTSRTYHTGVIRKRLLPMSLYPSNGEASEPQTLEWNPSVKVELPPSGTPLGVQGEKRSPGKFLRGWGNLGWGLCRLDYVGRVLQCQWEGGVVNVKPFLPEWGPLEKEVEGEQGVA